jgi:hypothetical protein
MTCQRISTRIDLKSRPRAITIIVDNAEREPNTNTGYPWFANAWCRTRGPCCCRPHAVHQSQCSVVFHISVFDPTMQLLDPHKYRLYRWNDNWTITSPARTSNIPMNDKTEVARHLLTNYFPAMCPRRGSVNLSGTNSSYNTVLQIAGQGIACSSRCSWLPLE